jgi:hypothetical protein
MLPDPVERTAQATEDLADAVRRAPSSLETFALSIASTAFAIVLAGVVLIVIADAVDLIEPINVWPLISLALVIAAVAAVTLVAGWRQRVSGLLREARAPWATERRLDTIEAKIDHLRTELQTLPSGEQSEQSSASPISP